MIFLSPTPVSQVSPVQYYHTMRPWSVAFLLDEHIPSHALTSFVVSVFTYRYFLERFPELCILAYPADKPNEPIGCVVGKVDAEDVTVATDDGGTATTTERTGYIGMLAVVASHRRLGIGASLVHQVLRRMERMGCVSVTLETEVSNAAAQRLYQDAFGFIREELLVRYYLNWGDAYRLRLWLVCASTQTDVCDMFVAPLRPGI